MANDATPTPKRVNGRTYPPKRYPRQFVLLVTEDLYQAISADAEREGEFKAVVARRYLEAGRAVTDAAERAARE